MKYPLKAANGDAGEFFFEYQIAYVLKWPCRLFDIDIGIDAQVEVMKNDETSTGRFVAFQIKERDLTKGRKSEYELNDPGEAEDLGDDELIAVDAPSGAQQDVPSGDKAYRYVTEAQYVYWREHGLPVFVALVDLTDKPLMYLHRVTPDGNYRKTKKGKFRIDFDLKRNLFTKESGQLIARAAEEATNAGEGVITAKTDIAALLEKVLAAAHKIMEQVATDSPDVRQLQELASNSPSIESVLGEAASLVTRFKVDPAAYNRASRELYKAFQTLREIVVRAELIADHGDPEGKLKLFVLSHGETYQPKLLD